MVDASAYESIIAGLATLSERYLERFREAADEPTLRNVRAEVLGKKGELTALLRGMGQVPPTSGRRSASA